MTRVQAVGFACVVVVLAVLAVHVLVPQRSGPLALSEVLEPYIVPSALVAAPFALRSRSIAGRVAVAIFVVAVLGRYGPGWISVPSSAEGQPLTVIAWNLQAGPDGPNPD